MKKATNTIPAVTATPAVTTTTATTTTKAPVQGQRTVANHSEASLFLQSFASVGLIIGATELEALNDLKKIAPLLKCNGKFNQLGHAAIQAPKNACFDSLVLALVNAKCDYNMLDIHQLHVKYYNVATAIDTNGKVCTLPAWFKKGQAHYRHLSGNEARNTLSLHCLPRVYSAGNIAKIAKAIEKAAPVLLACLNQAARQYANKVRSQAALTA